MTKTESPPDETVIRVNGLRKSYGAVEALKGVDLQVAKGEVFALLGPNGAGKTTAIEIMEGYRKRSAGTAAVLGQDPGRPSCGFRQVVGVVLQASSTDPEFTVKEALALYAGYYRAPRPVADVLGLVGLRDLAGRRVGRLSGGERRRLDVGLALVGDPELLFLDEPTTGFDPAARRDFWHLITELSGLGKTIFLTTHYMEEAEALADRVAILVGGLIIAEGSPAVLARQAEVTTVTFSLPRDVAISDVPASLQPLKGPRGTVLIETKHPIPALDLLVSWVLDRGLDLVDIEVAQPRLEDVYLRLTSASQKEAQ